MSGTLLQNLLEAAELLVGFVIVMFTLMVLWGLTALMSRVVARLQKPAVTSTAPAPSPLPTQPSTPLARTDGAETAGPSDEEMVVVAAAVALMLDRPHRLVRVLQLPSAWGQQGRLDAHSSHRL